MVRATSHCYDGLYFPHQYYFTCCGWPSRKAFCFLGGGRGQITKPFQLLEVLRNSQIFSLCNDVVWCLFIVTGLYRLLR